MDKVLVFTVAVHGYHWQYAENIRSHERYAKRNGYEYLAVSRPLVSTLDMEIAWLKMFLFQKLLEKDFDWILFVDADAEIRDAAPPLASLAEEGKSIYASLGYSGRINSGVMLLRNDSNSRDFVNKIVENMEMTLPAEDDVGWGENGHVIHFAHNNPSVSIIDRRWNNNFSAELDDYIRHYSAGPLRSYFIPSRKNHFLFRSCHYFLAIFKRFYRLNVFKNPLSKYMKLNRLASRVLTNKFV